MNYLTRLFPLVALRRQALLVVTLFFAIPLAFAETEGNFTYTVSNGEATITDYPESYSGDLVDLIIPGTLGGYPVTAIGNSAFYGCEALTSVTIPNSVTSIGWSAFRGCSNLTSITIPNSVTSIGNYAFYRCVGLTSITLPAGVTSIGNHVFYECGNLSAITLSERLTSIGDDAFTRCYALTAITLPESLTSIGRYAFYDCRNLAAIKIPDNVTTIGDVAFFYCLSLTSITIPDGVTTINNSVFKSCNALTSITLPNSVTTFKDSAFEGCSSLTSITLPDRLSTIESFVFRNCSALTSIKLPEGLTSIGSYAFEGCSPLTKVHFLGEPPACGREPFKEVSCSGTYLAEHSAAWQAVIVDGMWQNLTMRQGDANSHTVTFETDERGTFADGAATVQQVATGEDAVAPEVQCQAGYELVGWSGSLTGITADVTLQAVYRYVGVLRFVQPDETFCETVKQWSLGGGVVTWEVVDEGVLASKDITVGVRCGVWNAYLFTQASGGCHVDIPEPGIWEVVLTAWIDSEASSISRTFQVYIDPAQCAKVVFDGGEHGRWLGEWAQTRTQYFPLGWTPPAEELQGMLQNLWVDAGWVFAGWVGDSLEELSGERTVTATYRTLKADLHVDELSAPTLARTGETLEVRWRVGNTGNPDFQSQMTEEVRLVRCDDPAQVVVLGRLTEVVRVPRDGSVERSVRYQIPAKGLAGQWWVVVETALETAAEHGGVNSAQSAEPLTIEAVPLPDLSVKTLSGVPERCVPGEPVEVTFVVQNAGAGVAHAPWQDGLYLVHGGERLLLGTVAATADLAPGAEAARTLRVTLPELLPFSGEAVLFAKADAQQTVVEAAADEDAEDAAWLASPNTEVAQRLYLALEAGEVAENRSEALRGTARRSGEVAEAASYPLTVSGAGEAVQAPAEITFPAQARVVEWSLAVQDDTLLNGTRQVAFCLGEGEAAGRCTLAITDNEEPSLTLSCSEGTLYEGGGLLAPVTVTRDLVTDEPLSVYLSGVPASQCVYPSVVEIPAGEASVEFGIGVVNDEVAEVDRDYTLQASAIGHRSGSWSFTLKDDDVPGVRLTLFPEEVSEGAGVNAIRAVLARSDLAKVSTPVTVKLEATPAGQAIVPAQVVIPANCESVAFMVGVVDNDRVDGTREVTLDGIIYLEDCGCSAKPAEREALTARFRVTDNDSPALALAVSPATLKEGVEEAGWLTLSHNSTLSEAVTVTFAYAGFEDEIALPQTVRLEPGESSVRVPITTLDDGQADGDTVVVVSASVADGSFAPASTWLVVTDRNLPDLQVKAVDTVALEGVTGETLQAAFSVVNGGFAACDRAVPYAVHLVKDRQTALTEENRVDQSVLNELLPVGAEARGVTQTALPEEPGNYLLAVKVNPDASLTELDAANNVAYSEPITVVVAWTVAVQAAEERCLPGETVHLVGTAQRVDGAVAAQAAVEVYLLSNGFRRTLSAVTDAAGAFEVSFTPNAGEAGHYVVGAGYPGTGLAEEQDAFDVLGLARTSNAAETRDLTVGDRATIDFRLRNLSQVPLTGLAVQVGELPGVWEFAASWPEALPGESEGVLTLELTAIGLSAQEDWDTVQVEVTTAEGCTLSFPFYCHAQAQTAQLRASPAAIDTTMTVGAVRTLELTVFNDGQSDTGEVSVLLPEVPWLRLLSAPKLENLPPQSSAQVVLELAPAAEHGLALNAPLRGGSMAFQCAAGGGLSVPLAFTPVSTGTGTLSIDVTDDATWTLASAPHLAGAAIRVTNPYTGALVASGQSDAQGRWEDAELPPGLWQLRISADGHEQYADAVEIAPGRTTQVNAFLHTTLISYSWEVVRTEIEDSYEVRQVLEYNTSVPAPIVKVSMPEVFPNLQPGESWAFVIHLENTGLIQATEVQIIFPELEGYTFRSQDNDFTLPAKSSRDVVGIFSANPREVSRFAATDSPSQLASTENKKLPCQVVTGIHWSWQCGPNRVGEWVPVPIRFVDCSEVLSEILAKLLPDGWGSMTTPVRRPSGGSPSGVTKPTPPGPEIIISQRECSVLTPCERALMTCALDLLGNFFLPAEIASSAMSLHDCINGSFGSLGEAMDTIVTCSTTVMGLVPGSGVISTVASCLWSIGKNCIFSSSEVMSVRQEVGMLKAVAEQAEPEPSFEEATELAIQFYSSLANWLVEFLGDEAWLDVPVSDLQAFVQAVEQAKDASGCLSVEALEPARPSAISGEQLRYFVARWNATAELAQSGATVEPDDGQPFGSGQTISFARLRTAAEQMCLAEEQANAAGYRTVNDYIREKLTKEVDRLQQLQQTNVCATIRLSFTQTLAMTREAFDGTLTMTNGHSTLPVRDLKLDISVLDEAGVECRDLFVVFANGTGGAMSEGSALEGGLSLPAGATGSAMVRFIPSREAAPTVEKAYRFGGTLTYTDPFSGETATVALFPVTLTVSPSPYLKLDYFVQRDVYGDDPLTPETVEASMPAEIAVLIRNEGAGEARQVRIASVQPSVVLNEKGLAATFAVKDYSLDAAALNGNTAHLGLSDVALGDIPGGESRVAQWWLTASVDGHFTELSASVTPLNSWNTPDTALVNPEVGMHRLIRSLALPGEAMPYFLTCEQANLYGTPDTVYAVNGQAHPLREETRLSLSAPDPLLGERLTLTVTVEATRAGWFYGTFSLPGVSRYRVLSVARDGQARAERNAWTTNKVFRDGLDPLPEERLHLADLLSASGSYTYTLELAAKPTELVAVEAFDRPSGDFVEAPIESLVVRFTRAVDPASFTADALSLTFQGQVKALSGVTITPTDSGYTAFRIDLPAALVGNYGRYELVVSTAGLRDWNGQLGASSGKAFVWSLVRPDAPYILSTSGAPSRRVQSFDTLEVTLSTPIVPETMAQASFLVNGQAASLTVTPVPGDATNTRFTLSGLEQSQAGDGTYTLSILCNQVLSTAGIAGSERYDLQWTRDTTAPAVTELSRQTGLQGTRIRFAFTEALEPGSLTLANLRLTREPLPATAKVFRLAAADSSLPETAKITALGEGLYELSGIDAAVAEDGIYTLTLLADGLADEAGNLASGSTSLTWSTDVTPPDPVGELATSSPYGSPETQVVTAEASLTLSGTVSEAGLTLQVLSSTGAGETLLATCSPALGERFSVTVPLQGSGNLTLLLRLADPSGNTTTTALSVYRDTVALVATLSGEPDGESPAEEILLDFSEAPDPESVTLAAFSLLCDGAPVSLAEATLTQRSETAFVLGNLAEATAQWGEYTLAFDAASARKRFSGKAGTGSVQLAWSYRLVDRTPPVVEAITFDGLQPEPAYVTLFTKISARFSEAVNVPELIANGLYAQAFRVELLDEAGQVAQTLFSESLTWDAEALTATWFIDPERIPVGVARVLIDGSLLHDAAGNLLQPGNRQDIVASFTTFTPERQARVAAESYACPTVADFDGDGVLDLLVGEKAGTQGQLRLYRNIGNRTTPLFGAYTPLTRNGEPITFPASGCQGLQTTPGRYAGELVFGLSDGSVYLWDRLAQGEAGEALDEPRCLYTPAQAGAFAAKRAIVACFDLDGDGVRELIVGGDDGRFRIVRVTLRQGDDAQEETEEAAFDWVVDGQGVPLQLPQATLYRSAPAFADVNGDAVADLLSGDAYGNLWAFLGNGDGTFASAAISLLEGDGTRLRSRPACGDLTGDGIADLFIGYDDGSLDFAPGVANFSQAQTFRRCHEQTPEEAISPDFYWEGLDVWSTSQVADEAELRLTPADGFTPHTLTAAFVGSGTLSFTWGALGEDASATFVCLLDGVEVQRRTGPFARERCSFSVTGAGSHILAWHYQGTNTAILDDLHFEPDDPASQFTASTPVPVAYADLRTFANARWKAAAGDYESVANTTAANGRPIWENCIVGLDAEDPKAAFQAKIAIDAEGRPVVTWEPALNGEGVRNGVRTYTVFGATSLEARDWAPVAEGEEASCRFFRVRVEMPTP